MEEEPVMEAVMEREMRKSGREMRRMPTAMPAAVPPATPRTDHVPGGILRLRSARLRRLPGADEELHADALRSNQRLL